MAQKNLTYNKRGHCYNSRGRDQCAARIPSPRQVLHHGPVFPLIVCNQPAAGIPPRARSTFLLRTPLDAWRFTEN